MTLSTKLTFVWDNKADDATLSAGSWSGSLPLTNLQNRKLYKTARSTDDANASTKIRVQMDGDQPIQAVILVATLLSPEAQFRVKAYSDAYTTEIFNSGIRDVFKSMFSPNTGTYYWGVDPVWTGKPTESILARYSRDLIYLLDDAVVAEYWQIEIFDDTNPLGYVDIGRLIMGPIWQVTYNYSWGAKHGIRDLSATDTTLGGAFSYDEKSRARTFAFSLDYIEEDVAFQQAFEMDLQKGITGEVYVIPNYGDDLNLLRVSFLSHMMELDGLNARLIGFYGKAYSCEEIKG